MISFMTERSTATDKFQSVIQLYTPKEKGKDNSILASAYQLQVGLELIL